ncbi:ATP-dependent DNA helicase [Streptomonospora wellingtoniae]|uniref:DNA 5'-3' helicase n=1 Tax=Streptomonospora wellingtoniae TaxID=3075544 RepID=A0ABU2L076_9ACTN|nr:ATP-dependent DNA helicase [Streptomonospora sp. DSM 45055]MDT0304738.1 ATP-dependent DNA helicase [Streptomonospora sp. DSM 45055]
MAELPDADTLLDAAVRALGGTRREGQAVMAEAVTTAIDTGEHLVVQAGTGTGKSLAYLVPAIRHAMSEDTTVVVTTATLALQRQLIERDLPRLSAALAPLLNREPEFAILKGRRNYLCRHRLQGADAAEPEDTELFDPRQLSSVGRQVKRLHEWAEETVTGDRDELAPGVSDLAWRQVSVSANECVGAAACPFGQECFSEQARADAGGADVVVTNHAMLAISTMQGYHLLPEHRVLVIDEAHELVDRVTSVATGELGERPVNTAAKRAGRLVEAGLTERLSESGEGLALLFGESEAGRFDHLPDALAGAVAAVRDAAHACLSAIRSGSPEQDPDYATQRKQALAALDEVHDSAVRILESFEPPLRERTDVVWLAKGPKQSPNLHVAPLAVGGLLREKLFGDRTTVLTSATLALGGTFAPLAAQWGLGRESTDRPPAEAGSAVPTAGGAAPAGGPAESGAADDGTGGAETAAKTGGEAAVSEADEADDPDKAAGEPRWRGLDVGSPFDHARSGILYVARHLPPPGRDGLDPSYLDEIAGLVEASGGRTLGLFSSMRAAAQAAEELRERVDVRILCQGDDSTGRLVEEFAEEEDSCLFGTLSLWQGVDVPGRSLQLVIVDRIPFPRPDDPLASARQRAVGARGGNGFMAVAATHAALLLAQGTGRLLRSAADRGVVAVLDPRLATARYGGFLRSSLPPYWGTTDPEVARAALHRLAADPVAG